MQELISKKSFTQTKNKVFYVHQTQGQRGFLRGSTSCICKCLAKDTYYCCYCCCIESHRCLFSRHCFPVLCLELLIMQKCSCCCFNPKPLSAVKATFLMPLQLHFAAPGTFLVPSLLVPHMTDAVPFGWLLLMPIIFQ